jgi:FtsP/CotA-like multicopper oxidase with cupredoxin domain
MDDSAMVMRHINRRVFVQAFGASLLMPHAAVAQDVQTLIAAKIKEQLLGPDNPPTEHFQFGNAILRAKQGQPLRFRASNTLDEEVILHFFGVRGDAEMMTIKLAAKDSVGTEVIFTPPDAGTFWFGPLVNASRQRELGLSGMLIVDEAVPQPFQDIPLVIDDWSLRDDGAVEEDFGNLTRAAGEGRLGNWFTANGKLKPRIELAPEQPARIRLLNIANSRTMNVRLKNADGIVIARDGQPIPPQPLGLEALQLAPGQRADLLLTEAQELVTVMLDVEDDAVEAAFLVAPGYGRKTLQNDFSLPTNPHTPPDVASAYDVVLPIEGGLKGGLQKARVGQAELDLRAMLERGLAWAIGGSAGLGAPPLFEVERGQTLRLTFDNKTAFEQPVYVHGHVWTENSLLPLGLLGAARWSDTLIVPAKAQVQVLMVADNPGTWAIQSLLAERADAGLIGAFTVSDMP